MNTQDLIRVACNAGCEVVEYENHYCVKRTFEISVTVTIPKAKELLVELVEKIRELLGF